MELEKAVGIAGRVVQELSPHCERIEVAGSIRRKRPFVHDIDLVCIPSSGAFVTALQSLGQLKVGGQKVLRVNLPEMISLDVYVATPSTWATLLLIRTGSAKHNVRLCSLAKSKGMRLHADGSGLFAITTRPVLPYQESMNNLLAIDDEVGERIAGDTEESIFAALGRPYKRPEERE